MVQGNSARRKELAANRRQDQKEEKSRKKGGAARATPVEARARLLDWAGSDKCLMLAWTEDATGEKNVCQSYFRTGSCPRKRCRLSHDDTISFRLTGVPGDFDESVVAEHLPPMVSAQLEMVAAGGKLSYDKNLRTQRREKNTLLFVEYKGELVYDAENPVVFQSWAEATSGAHKAADAAVPVDVPAAKAPLSENEDKPK